jgi:hypothetical protein
VVALAALAFSVQVALPLLPAVELRVDAADAVAIARTMPITASPRPTGHVH